MNQITKLYQQYRAFLDCMQDIKRSVLAFIFCLPTSIFALFLVLLLTYNGFSVFCVKPSFPAKSSPEPANFLPERESSQSSSSSSVMYAVKEESPPAILKTHLPLLEKPEISRTPTNSSSVFNPKRLEKRRPVSSVLKFEAKSKHFSAKVEEFLDNSSCKLRFFMTWISSIESFSGRELLAVESLFKSHPDACLVMVSASLDSKRGSLILKPFLKKGFKVIAVTPDFDYIFQKTNAETWFDGLKRGIIDPGEVSLGQNLSNLLRLSLLYKFGGVYLDTDVVILKSFSNLSNVIGAQAMDAEKKNWSRLNNAVLIFDKKHPLLFNFIQEFALTFNGNKWGHNGPYLVSRVVARINEKPGFNFTILPPHAFYPVDWTRIQSLFRGPGNDSDQSKWLQNKLVNIRRQSFAVHLWNRQSRELRIEKGSIIDHIISDCCIFCNSSGSSL
ncbi:lactosylceramide 4-alpha-galactosyltransferase [Carica papaya]|uniref:lactosylceramide 4-alpha-galactosyltransferase n=1 Tax=Carica papaya TaxID=3649 RepID=UPI000B8D188F|nr:lactosylceramide 4-alpha-galactosyltransferase [Carica papaya]